MFVGKRVGRSYGSLENVCNFFVQILKVFGANAGDAEGLEVAGGGAHREHHFAGELDDSESDGEGQADPDTLFDAGRKFKHSSRDGKLMQSGSKVASVFEADGDGNGWPQSGTRGSSNLAGLRKL